MPAVDHAVTAAQRVAQGVREGILAAPGERQVPSRAPATRPAPVVERLQAETAHALQEARVLDAIRKFGGTPLTIGGEAFTAFTQAEHRKWKAIIERSGAKLD